MKTILLLLLMTSVCWADDYIKWEFDGNKLIGKVSDNVINKTYKISCPDGYKLDYVITDRTMDSRCKNPNVVCMPIYKYTDAEIKCVKE